MFGNTSPLTFFLVTTTLLFGCQRMTVSAADDIADAFEFRDVWPSAALIDEVAKQNVKAWTPEEKITVVRAIEEAKAAAPGVYARAIALGRMPLYRTGEETEVVAAAGGFDRFNVKFTETFFKQPENYRVVTFIHELVHVLDTGRRVSHDAAWAKLMKPVFEQVDAELSKRGIASPAAAGKQLSRKEAAAWGLPTFYARTNLTEALAEYVSHLAISDTLGVTVPDTIPDAVRKFVEKKFFANEFKTDSAIIAYVKGRRLLQAGKSLEAMIALTEAIKHDEDFADAYFSRGVAFLHGRQSDAAISDFNRYATLSQETAADLGDLLPKDERSGIKSHLYLLFRGEALGKKGELDKAMADFSEFIDLHPENEAGYRNMARELGKAGKFAAALTNVERALVADPENIQSRFLRGRILVGTKDYAGAVRDYTDVLDRQPDYPEARKWRIKARVELGDVDGALADYDWMLEQTPDNLGLRYQRGEFALKAKRYEQAVQDFSNVIDRCRTNPSERKKYILGYDRRATAYAALKKYEQAIEDYNELLETLPEYDTAYFQRGILLAKQKRFDEAIRDYDKFIEKVPDFAYAYFLRAGAWRGRQEVGKALADYGQAIQRDPKLSAAYYDRARLYLSDGRFDNAIADFTRVIELKPDVPDAYGDRGDAWFAQEEFQKAVDDFTRLIEGQPQSIRGHDRRGLAHLASSNFEAAVADFARVIELSPKFMYGYMHRANALDRWGRYEGVSADYDRVIAISSKYPGGYQNLAWFYATCPSETHRNGVKAVELASRACELTDFKQDSSLGALAAAYAETGDFEKAVHWQQKAMEAGSEEYRAKWGFLGKLYGSKKPYRKQAGNDNNE
jgi:tetratricopeptide (TPR) repeat protein